MLLGNRIPAQVQEGALLVARVVVGAVFALHGWQKVAEFGISGTAESFGAMGVPAAEAAATFAAVVELVGGLMLVVGLLTPVAAVLLAADMLGAWWFVHRGAGVFVSEGGWELVAVLGVAALLIGAVGPGRLSVDGLALGRRRA
jgi:putative oxidoreductase